MGAVAVYAVLGWFYLRHLERPHSLFSAGAPRVSDVFDKLTYRERYEELVERSGRDALTGLLDRGRLEAQGRRAIDEAALTGQPASLLLIYVDHFKSFNDQYGHVAGDAALKRIAAQIMSSVRASDLVFRFGGEEFVVISEGLVPNQRLHWVSAFGARLHRMRMGRVSRSASALQPVLMMRPTITACSRSQIRGPTRPNARAAIA